MIASRSPGVGRCAHLRRDGNDSIGLETCQASSGFNMSIFAGTVWNDAFITSDIIGDGAVKCRPGFALSPAFRRRRPRQLAIVLLSRTDFCWRLPRFGADLTGGPYRPPE